MHYIRMTKFRMNYMDKPCFLCIHPHMKGKKVHIFSLVKCAQLFLSVWSVNMFHPVSFISHTGLWTLDYSFEICQLFYCLSVAQAFLIFCYLPKFIHVFAPSLSLPLSRIRRYMWLSSSDYSDPVEQRASCRDVERGRRGEMCQCEKNIRPRVSSHALGDQK